MKRDEVFISYRRSDTEASATALRLSLEAAFGAEALFQDVADIDPGDPWPQVLQDGLAHALVVLVVIGPDWLTVADKYGDRRLNLPGDWVANEVTLPLADEAVKVIPVLVDRASMPTSDELARLPEGLRKLDSCQSCRLEHATWGRDVRPLLDVISKTIGRPISADADSPLPAAVPRLERSFSVSVPRAEQALVGRSHALDSIYRLLNEGQDAGITNTVALVGMPGSGKTALAEELLRRHDVSYPGTVAVEHRSIDDTAPTVESVFARWVRDFGGDARSDRAYSSAEVRHLLTGVRSELPAEAKLALLVDDVWANDVDDVERLLDAMPHDSIRLITTQDSDVAVRLRTKPFFVEPLLSSQAVELVHQLLRDRWPRLAEEEVAELIDRNSDVIAKIAQDLGGLPLALRLGIGACDRPSELDSVADRVRRALVDGHRVRAAARESVNRLEIEARPAPSGPGDRYRELIVGLSVGTTDLLDEYGPRLVSRFQSIGVFPDHAGLTLDILARLWGGDAEDDEIRDDIRILTDKNLLHEHRSGVFAVQPVIRSFAEGELAHSGQRSETEQRYLAAVIELVESGFKVAENSDDPIVTPAPVAPLRRTRLDAAASGLEDHVEQSRRALTIRLEAIGMTVADHCRPEQSPGHTIDPRLAESIDVRLGARLAWNLREAVTADVAWPLTLLEIGLALARVVGDRAVEYEYLGSLGRRWTLSKPDLALEYVGAAEQIAAEADPRVRARVLTWTADVRRRRAEFDEALEIAMHAASEARTAGDRLAEADALLIRGEIHWRRSDTAEAEECYQIAESVYAEVGDEQGLADTLNKRASNMFNIGRDYRGAIAMFEDALERHQRLADVAMQAEDLNDMGACYRYLGEINQAVEYFGKALELNERLENFRLQAVNQANIAGSYWLDGLYPLARDHARQAQRLAIKAEDEIFVGWGKVWEGLGLAGEGELNSALVCFEDAAKILYDKQDRRGEAGALARQGLLLYEMDHQNLGDARDRIEDALAILRSAELERTFTNLSAIELQEWLDAHVEPSP